ncbi:aldo/keto reductase [Nocardia sp. BMG111209]|uniref:aldo/keto reductase n=1 Tax=Nocardia sp. BMG111209 TaxID=1160137 RepID=UPI00038299B5|nr:aldo/keto reductase [Nocardia sp. BMG111209]
MSDQRDHGASPLTSRRRFGATGLAVCPIVLGTMQFGWTLSSVESMRVLDRYRELGGNVVDTADMYGGDQSVESFRHNRAHVGTSEEIIGRWLETRSCRDEFVLDTKVRARMWDGPDGEGLGRAHVTRAVEDSLRRLRTDTLDILWAHWPEPGDDLVEFLSVAADLIAAGKVRFLGTSNFCDFAGNGDRLSPMLQLAAADAGLPSVAAEQPRYNLLNRAEYETTLQALTLRHDLGIMTYSSLASGFLAGAATPDDTAGSDARERQLSRYRTPAGWELLDRITAIAATHGTTRSAVALAWTLAQPGVTATIIGPQAIGELEDAAPAATLTLDRHELDMLTAASWWASEPEFVVW